MGVECDCLVFLSDICVFFSHHASPSALIVSALPWTDMTGEIAVPTDLTSHTHSHTHSRGLKKNSRGGFCKGSDATDPVIQCEALTTHSRERLMVDA